MMMMMMMMMCTDDHGGATGNTCSPHLLAIDPSSPQQEPTPHLVLPSF